MTITSALFEAFLGCLTKCFLQAEGALPSGKVYAEWIRAVVESYRVPGKLLISGGFEDLATL
jgi:hypothetical protein